MYCKDDDTEEDDETRTRTRTTNTCRHRRRHRRRHLHAAAAAEQPSTTDVHHSGCLTVHNVTWHSLARFSTPKINVNDDMTGSTNACRTDAMLSHNRKKGNNTTTGHVHTLPSPITVPPFFCLVKNNHRFLDCTKRHTKKAKEREEGRQLPFSSPLGSLSQPQSLLSCPYHHPQLGGNNDNNNSNKWYI
jgi:hypothetical protein